MSDGLLESLKRRFSAVAEPLPRALPALESEDPLPFLVRYRRDALAGIDEGLFRRMRGAVRDERDLMRRRRTARRALETAGKLTDALAAKIDASRDAVWLEDLLRPWRKDKAGAQDPMLPAARAVLGAEAAPAATAASPATPEPVAAAPAADAAARVTAGDTASADSATPPADAAPVAADAAPVAAPDAAPVAATSSAPSVAPSLEEILLPFCGANGAAPTVNDQRARLVRLVADLIGEDADLRATVRSLVKKHGIVVADVAKEHAGAPTWKPFHGLRTPLSDFKARLALSMRRGQKLGAVSVKVELPEEHRAAILAGPLAPVAGHPYADLVAESAKEALTRILIPAAGSELLRDRRRQAERGILPRIAETLEERLMAPPAGAVPVVAVVPGSGGSARITVVGPDGRAGSTIAVHPFAPAPENERLAAGVTLLDLVRSSGAKLVAVAGSKKARACREWVSASLAGVRDLGAAPVPLHEGPAGEFAESDAGKLDAPELPATGRVALSLGRLVQDPLREASRYDLTELPLDQHQRDVDQGELRRLLDEVYAECVAGVGVDVNTAPASLLSRVPGLDAASAAAIVASRTKDGAFASRTDVKRCIPEDAWQIAAGFFRIPDAIDPLDRTGVHPQGAPVAAAIAAAKGTDIAALVRNPAALEGLDPKTFVTEAHTESDVLSVFEHIAKGSADPRGTYAAPAFNPGLDRLEDVQVGAELEGVVNGLSKFGAFVDVGLRQLGLVHVSEIAHAYIQDPAQAVSDGQRVRVKVLAVDPAKRRLSLSMKALLPVPERPAEESRPRRPRREGDFAGAGAAGAAPRGADGPHGPFGAGSSQAFSGGDGRGPRRVGDRPARGPGGPGGPGGPRGPGGPGGGPGGGGGRPFGGRGGRPGDRTPDRPAGPERPGTAPRRASKFGRKRDDDRSGQMFTSYARNRDEKKGPKAAAQAQADAEAEAMAPPPKLLPKPLDPFLAQLLAAKSQLGISGGGRRPVADTPAVAVAAPAAPQPVSQGSQPMTSEERRQARRAAARAEAAARAAANPAPAPAEPAAQPAPAAAEEPAQESAATTEPSGSEARPS